MNLIKINTLVSKKERNKKKYIPLRLESLLLLLGAMVAVVVVVGCVDVVVVVSGPVEMCWWCWCGSDGGRHGCGRVWSR